MYPLKPPLIGPVYRSGNSSEIHAPLFYKNMNEVGTNSPTNGSNSPASAKDEEGNTKKQKVGLDLPKKHLPKYGPQLPPKKGIQIKLGAQKSWQPSGTGVKPQSQAMAAAFNIDDDEEPEEMPPEARMRMRNIGRETPTSAGPNSFGKTKQGFCDAKKMFEKNMKKAIDSTTKPAPPPPTPVPESTTE
uniref:PEST proteolytic signal-containing nuclear protein n=1 Tax=Timema bartmani TaxID=61472 RepID=A0A7R9ETB4_9NEOP|nr:unnamed protein product [Timema bartmani]